MKIKYALWMLPEKEHLKPITKVLKEQDYCCNGIINAVQEDIYIDHEKGTAEIHCYDHNNQIFKYCWNCGKPITIECVGQVDTKRNDAGILVPA